MTRIDRPNQITNIGKIEKTKSGKSNKSNKTTQTKTSKISFQELEKKLLAISKNAESSYDQKREKIVREMITWQFGEQALNNPQFVTAYNKLKETTEQSEAYKSIIDKFLNPNE